MTNQNKTYISQTWNAATETWTTDGGRTWQDQTAVTNDSKTTMTVTNITKH